MQVHRELSGPTHSHRYIGHLERQNARRMLLVAGLTAIVMGVEIIAGIVTGSMALLADGWHMGSHVAALGLSAFAYAFARRHEDNHRYSFGTGKVGPLAGFASAILLALIALGMSYESIERLLRPVAIDYSAAILVTAVGLAVNLGSALLLGGHDHEHHHHEHGGHSHGHDHDHNMRSAYIHVLADALTSFLALVALAGGAMYGLWWLDPATGLIGSAVILKWTWDLIKSSSDVLLDAEPDSSTANAVRSRIEAEADSQVVDLHLWLVGRGHLALILSVMTHRPRSPVHYKALLEGIPHLSHVTVEVISCDDPARLAA